TARRHMESWHRGEYMKWCAANDFKSMLPKDTERRRQAKQDGLAQGTLDGVMVKAERKEAVVPYTDANFLQAAIEWMIATDQSLWVLEHPAFRKMIDVASRATHGVKLPKRKVARKEIMNMFWKFLCDIKARFSVHPVFCFLFIAASRLMCISSLDTLQA
ncbi:hypothetical protein DFH05DRAFT_1408068, partial [Lentinula detonsa]